MGDRSIANTVVHTAVADKRIRQHLAQMTDRVRIIKHEAVPQCGSFGALPGLRPSVYFYWDDLPSRRLNPQTLDRETALEKAKAVAMAAEGSRAK